MRLNLVFNLLTPPPPRPLGGSGFLIIHFGIVFELRMPVEVVATFRGFASVFLFGGLVPPQNFFLRMLSRSPFLFITAILAICGWSIAFSGACILKVLHGAWWVIVYQFCIVSGHLLVFLTGSVKEYRITMVAVLASSVPMLTIQVDYVIQLTKTKISSAPGNAYVAGYIILLVVHYAWLFVLGSDETTWLGQLRGPGDYFKSSRVEPENIVEKAFQNESSSQLITPLSSTGRIQTLRTYRSDIQNSDIIKFVEAKCSSSTPNIHFSAN
ncbi:hypothetical protein BD560DRAFT_491387 [Blakeslea trispora]|nr:hypothetical protein BD560DRAFT_491387 [Blakeslea trispora]